MPADLIILRLHPAKQMAASDFTSYLNGLTITAFDLTYGNSVDGVQIGVATGVANNHIPSTSNNAVNINGSPASTRRQILQHYIDVNDPPILGPLTRQLESVATAVIVVNPPAGHPEYPDPSSFDVRIKLQHGGMDVPDHTIDFNVEVTHVGGALSTNQKDYFAMSASAYVTLPAATVGIGAGLAFVDLPDNGQPPGFDNLVTNINLVLAKDPGATVANPDLQHLSPLTAAQSAEIASEIIWNRTLNPPPEPKRLLGQLYTKPPADPALTPDDVDKADQDRKEFEGELQAYEATLAAQALRLGGFVFAASAAVACEQVSAKATAAGLTFPVITPASSPTTVPDTAVLLTDPVALNPAFIVPAAYFYALGAMLAPQVTAAQRYDMARFQPEAHLLSDFQIAIDADAITVPAAPITPPVGPAIAPAQAARRLHALGTTNTDVPSIPLQAPISVLLNDPAPPLGWLNYAGDTATADSAFWTPEIAAQPAAYLELLLESVTDNFAPLIAAIKAPPLNVNTVAALVAVTDAQWRDFFLGPPPRPAIPPGLALLPPFTAPGTPADRVEAFIRHLRNFFTVPSDPGAAPPSNPEAPSTLPISIADAFLQFSAAYTAHGGGVFTFGGAWNFAAVQPALLDVFPGDPEAQAWLLQALQTIDALFRVTDIAVPGMPELHFSLIEALFSRGFTSAADVNAFSEADFQEALTGTVAYPHASDIWTKAGAIGPAPKPAKGGFSPVNPDGLTNCIPPPCLSPLGPVEYLAELLRVCMDSNCGDPFPEEDGPTLAELLAGRRGHLGDLHATCANLETPIPFVDLVNESLESLAAGLPATTGGAVYDTAEDQLDSDHKLCSEDADTDDSGFCHDPQTLFATMAEHSSPATPVEQPAAYDELRADFSAPNLPYAQALDIARSYLGYLGTTRYSAMRHFRKEITEFAIDPANEPADFQRHLWRYPVGYDIAREYLRISQDEYDSLYSKAIVTVPTPGQLLLRDLYGFADDLINGVPWTQIVSEVPEFLARTGLSYCEFLELWQAQFVVFGPAGGLKDFPKCQPCCPANLGMVFIDPADPLIALRKLSVFIRLWRRLQELPGPEISFAQLRDICDVLQLFIADAINPDFLRQLAALLMLRDNLRLPLADGKPVPPAAIDADRTHLLAIWLGPAAPHWDWAVTKILDRVEDYAEAHHNCPRRGPEFVKILSDNLDALSLLTGFDPTTPSDTWFAHPTSTVRFAEVLAKIYASHFTVGEILFLFTTSDHLDGDDPFALSDLNEALDQPLELPDEEDAHGLWALRRELLNVQIDDESVEAWTWPRIESSLRREFGYVAPGGGSDPLDELGEHFFPRLLEQHGHAVPVLARQYLTDLPAAQTTPLMWNSPPDGPFRYQTASQKLYTQLPVRDEQVFAKLSELRQLTGPEPQAVQELYFAPRRSLLPFSPLFSNFGEALDHLVEEPDEHKRWRYFRREFACFHRRCQMIATHLEEHVEAATGQEPPEDHGAAWRVLRGLYADENVAIGPWEDDSGAVPAVTWSHAPSGGAFAGLLGLVGTGLLGEFKVGGNLAWREARGPLTAFGRERNEWNAPVCTVIPSTGLTLTPQQQRFAAVRNGFAMQDVNGEPLGGGQPFTVFWSGALLVEREGDYRFFAGAPTAEDAEPDFANAREAHWRVKIRRGQRTWILLNHRWPGEDGPAARSAPIALRRGAYQINVDFEQREPEFARAEDVCRAMTGFQVKYAGPDSDDRTIAIPLSRLFRDHKDATLAAGIEEGPAIDFLKEEYTSTLRDIRRTYQRAFKSLLFAHRFRLLGKPLAGERESELDYLLGHGDEFLGTSYYRSGPATFKTHHAFFDFNLLPVGDPYLPPPAAQDERVQPSAKRRAALFDWWERLFDYCKMRAETRPARERPAWLLFYEAAEHQPDDPAQLLRHIGVDIRHAPLVLSYFATPAAYAVTIPDLEDERWPVRIWQAEKWLRALETHFVPEWIGAALPTLWAADDPGTGAPSGNSNLTQFVQDGCFENGAPRRYDDVKRLNDGLRERARAALVAYLCGMNRVAIPWGAGLHALTARDLSELLLQDVNTGICERASRIEDAVSAIQTFVQRARLGLEPGFTVTPAFAELWDSRFATFDIWEVCKRREVYRENWIDWDELQEARKVEAFQFLESELRRATLTVPVPGGMEWWPGQRPPRYGPLVTLQSRAPSEIELFNFNPWPVPEGLGLLGTPEPNARPSWLAPILRQGAPSTGGGGSDGTTIPANPDNPNVPASPATPSSGPEDIHSLVVSRTAPPGPIDRLPFWIQAAIRLGTRFIRVAAAGVPPASTEFAPRELDANLGCCCECGKVHPPRIDEYYFWLQDERYFDDQDAPQDADLEATLNNGVSAWHLKDRLPSLLHWDTEPAVHLFWCRVHNGEFQQPRRSEERLPVTPGSFPMLDYKGRTLDSLRFEVSGGIHRLGYLDPTAPGFRYDIASDSAVPLPLVVVPPAPVTGGLPGGLLSYPYFAYFAPGAHVEPPSLFSVALTVGATLRAHCSFEAALKWYGLALNPFSEDNTWAICPEQNPPTTNLPGPNVPGTNVPAGVVPAGNPAGANTPAGMVPAPHSSPDAPSPSETGSLTLDPAPAGGATNLPVETAPVPVVVAPRPNALNQPCCPSEPVSDDVARDRAVLLHFLETLLQWGDALRCRNAPEAFQQAMVVYEAIEHVLGNHPATTILEDDEFPTPPQTLAAFVPAAAPLNPRLLSLYDRVADRVAITHACLSDRRLRNGRPNIDMPYWGDDPLRDGWRTAACTCGCDDGWCACCCEPYRFTFLIQKAIEHAVLVRGFGAAYLSACEKGDAEFLASLRATQERQLLELGLEVRQNQWRDADWQVQSLQKAKEGAQTRQRYYQNLIANGLNAGENAYVSLTGTSASERAAGNVSEAIAQGVGIIPDMWLGAAGIAGTPVDLNQLPIGVKLAHGFSAAAHILNALADIAGSNASLSLTQGGWDRREQEWRHQVEVIGIEIEQIERQILGAERRRDVALRELNNHQRQIDNAIELQNFLRDKFTNYDLYLFLEQETAALHYQAYELARYTARQAERAFNFERGFTTRTFLCDEPWENRRDGLLAGERLELSLRQMEKAYLDENCREYELTKHISLRLNFPLDFLHLQTAGYCEIEIPEWMFDLDYPGQYMRRIRNVSLTIPCVVGPYTGVHCRLTLLSCSTRIDPRLDEPPVPCCDDIDFPLNGYEPLPEDPRIVHQYRAKEAIATSAGQNDSGLFELNFRDERYLPFEYAGAVSRWRLELPPENNYFDMDTVTDVILHLNYTAREGGEVLRRAANEVAQQHLPGGGLRYFDIRHDFPEAWARLHAGEHGHRLPSLLPLQIGRAHFPFLPGHRAIRIDSLHLFFELEDPDERAIQIVRLFSRHEVEHGADEPCDCGGLDIECDAGAEWPCLYHGVLDVHLERLGQGRERDQLILRFPHAAGRITRAFVVFGYEASGWLECAERSEHERGEDRRERRELREGERRRSLELEAPRSHAPYEWDQENRVHAEY
jgi:hypothetical protein